MLLLMRMALAVMLWLPLASYSAPPLQGGLDSLAVVAVAGLPAEARDTLSAIRHGGPFPYPRDGVVFNNFERVLPERQRGYYHEYTVKTRGVNNRGVRRIVCGPFPECYYTADHYQTFKRIQE
ncbi:MAG: ribonuclease domain-containing protein [Gallionella sp.]